MGASAGSRRVEWLHNSPTPLWQAYDVAMLDLDGVVYVGSHAVVGVAEHLSAARALGLRLAYVTNNASRTPEVIAEQLRALGLRV